MGNPKDTKLMLSEDDRQGWFKLILPTVTDLFGSLWHNPAESQIELMPFVYGKLNSDPVAFDLGLSHPMYAVDRLCLVQIDRTPTENVIIPVDIIGLTVISSEQEGRCYIAVSHVTCIIPVKPEHSMVDTLIKATTEQLVVTPTPQETSGILNLPGNKPT